jgi:hypothetical protein
VCDQKEFSKVKKMECSCNFEIQYSRPEGHSDSKEAIQRELTSLRSELDED